MNLKKVSALSSIIVSTLALTACHTLSKSDNKTIVKDTQTEQQMETVSQQATQTELKTNKVVHYLSQNNKTWQAHLAEIKKVKSYKASGTVEILLDNDPAFTKPVEATYSLDVKNDKQFELFIFSKDLGQSIKINYDNGDTVIQEINANQSLVENKIKKVFFNLDFPYAYLKEWMKGQPNPAKTYKVNQDYLLDGLQLKHRHNDWSLKVKDNFSANLKTAKELEVKGNGVNVNFKVVNFEENTPNQQKASQ